MQYLVYTETMLFIIFKKALNNTENSQSKTVFLFIPTGFKQCH